MDIDLQNFVEKYKSKIDLLIAQELDHRIEEVERIAADLVPILTAMKEMSVGGKRLRALLVILGWQIGRQSTAYSHEQEGEIIKAAVVMELFHLGLLIQDDFMDRDFTRRGVATMIARFPNRHEGNFVSMLAGDYTFGWGMEILSSLNLPHSQIVAALRVWGKYFTRVGYGQTLDGLAVADNKTILKILELKSGEYSCVLPLVLGATIAGASKETIKNLQSFGMELGWVFQLRDDWLGEYGDLVKTGKPVGNDSREGKKTYATMHSKKETETEIKNHMDKACRLISYLREDSFQNEVNILEKLVQWVGSREN